MGLGLRIILDKSVVYGLNKTEVDSLDRYFFQIIPPILTNEILADLSKEPKKPEITNKISAHSYRISGNRGITVNYRELLGHSLLGNEIPMEGKFLPAGQRMVQSDGKPGAFVETKLEDETISRWESKSFTQREKDWAKKWRITFERKINPKIYTDKIKEASLKFSPPENDEELVEKVDTLLNERSFQGKLLVLLAKEHKIPFKSQIKIINRWNKEGKPMIKNFAPYAFFCARVNFLWALGLTNPQLFKHDKNDRKDMEYCYYLPHCEIFSSKDDKHKRIVPFLLKSYQQFVYGEELKADLRELSEQWDKLSKEKKIEIYQERGKAPPENENSIIFQLWRNLRGKVSAPMPLEILEAKIVDSNLPEDKQEEITFGEWLRSMSKKLKDSESITYEEFEKLEKTDGKINLGSFLMRTTKVNKERLLNMYPHLNESDLDEKDSR